MKISLVRPLPASGLTGYSAPPGSSSNEPQESVELGAPEPAPEPAPRGPRWKKLALATALGVTGFLAVGNGLIVGTHALMQEQVGLVEVQAEVPGVRNLYQVDDHVWRGSAPGERAYQALADQGVSTVIDLRAEHDLHFDEAWLTPGMRRIHIPIRDGQAPSDEQVEQLFKAIADSPGRVYVHCGAGVGRTGSMIAAYEISQGLDSEEALKHMLAVGPPSLEQIAWVRGQDNPVITGVSRALDAPRRLWSYLD